MDFVQKNNNKKINHCPKETKKNGQFISPVSVSVEKKTISFRECVPLIIRITFICTIDTNNLFFIFQFSTIILCFAFIIRVTI
jgi:hypothetical protein